MVVTRIHFVNVRSAWCDGGCNSLYPTLTTWHIEKQIREKGQEATRGKAHIENKVLENVHSF